MARRKSFSDEIREAIDASGLSHAEVCRRTGIHKSPLSRFMASKVGLSLATIDRLADVLGLHVASRPAKGRKGR